MATSYGLPFTTRPEIKGTFGVAASTHWIATAVAMRTLERGGNAFDAAVACAFTLQVVEPHLTGPGANLRTDLERGRRAKRSREADRESARRLVPRLRRGRDRSLLPRRDHGLHRPAAPRAADGQRHGRVVGDLRR